MTGGLLPSVPVVLGEGGAPVQLAALLAGAGGCSLVVAASVDCPYCRAMRLDWGSRVRGWADSVDTPVASFWMFEDEWAEIRTFWAGYDMDPSQPVFADRRVGPGFDPLGIFGTPITYLVDAAGRLRYGTAGDLLPPVAVGSRVCKERP